MSRQHEVFGFCSLVAIKYLMLNGFNFFFSHKNWLIDLWSSICGIIDKKLSFINGIGYQMDQHEKCDNAKRELTHAF